MINPKKLNKKHSEEREGGGSPGREKIFGFLSERCIY